ncbi:MAG: hypothetical protein ACM34A_12200 [Bacillota bacterium]
MSGVTLPAPREPAIDPRTNTFSRNWILYFQQVFERVGGGDADTIAAISAFIRQIFQDLADNEVERAFSDLIVDQDEDYLEFAPAPVVAQDQADIATYEAQIVELRKQVEDLRLTVESLSSDARIAELRKQADEISIQLAMDVDQSAQVGEIRKRLKDIAKPTVTGSRGANAALASLLTSLANYGLITDSTTA